MERTNLLHPLLVQISPACIAVMLVHADLLYSLKTSFAAASSSSQMCCFVRQASGPLWLLGYLHHRQQAKAHVSSPQALMCLPKVKQQLRCSVIVVINDMRSDVCVVRTCINILCMIGGSQLKVSTLKYNVLSVNSM